MDLTNTMYHYTSQKGFEGIVREDGIHLWFSDARYMNDSSELINAKKFLMKAADELLEEKRIDKSIYKQLEGIRYNPKKFDDLKFVPSKNTLFGFEIRSADYHKFICCFSKEADSLPMWNYYLKGDENGYAIGLNLDGINTDDCEIVGRVKNKADYKFDEEIKSMLYDDEEKLQIFKSEILDFADSVSKYSEDSIERLSYGAFFQQSFEYYSCVFKDYHFAYENERRIMVTVKDSDELYIDGQKRDDIKFRLSHGLAIPYFELLIPNKKVLKAVSISPRIGLNSSDDMAKESMRAYLQHLGYEHNINIRCSQIPLRYY